VPSNGEVGGPPGNAHQAQPATAHGLLQRLLEAMPACAAFRKLPDQVLIIPAQYPLNAAMVSAAVRIDFTAEKRSIVTLCRRSESAPLKVVWRRRLRGGVRTCWSRNPWWSARLRLCLAADRHAQSQSTESDQSSPLEVCRTHGTLLCELSRESTLQEAPGKRRRVGIACYPGPQMVKSGGRSDA